jgi:hypothetical protein
MSNGDAALLAWEMMGLWQLETPTGRRRSRRSPCAALPNKTLGGRLAEAKHC